MENYIIPDVSKLIIYDNKIVYHGNKIVYQGNINQCISHSNKYYVYLLQSITKPKRTYIGYTINLARRLRQHNGEISGGANKTKYARPWKMIGYVSGFPNSTIALQYEWVNNHPKMMGLTRRFGLNGRIKTMYDGLLKERFTSNSPLTRSLNLRMNWIDHTVSFPYIINHCNEIYI
uniref:GIY-YIG catalytic domain protein n=1 Tax=Pithovirus LCPAC102 TaxID=2506587 RepID=A0A4D5XFI2_9VIRU|nr:MAG: GIY-YIG catalytic domain protein [Pithovirus LCPAC102]